MVCKQCGTQLPETAKFCSACGSAVVAEQETQAEILQPETQIDIQENIQTEVQVEVEPEIQAVTESEIQTEMQPEIEPDVQAETPKQMPPEIPAQVQATNSADISQAKKVKKENKFLRGFLSVLCCIMIFIFSMTTLSLFIVRGTLAENNVKKLLDNIDVEEVINEDTMKNFDEYIVYDSVEDIYKKSSIKNYIKKIATQYTDYLLGGKEPHGIEADDIIKLMEKNQEDIEEIMDRPLTELDYVKAYEFFEENGEENLGILSAECHKNDSLFFARLVLSVFTVIVSVLITLLFIFLLLKVRRFRLDSMIWMSVPLILTSLTIGIFGSIRPLTIALFGDVEPIVKAAARVIMSAMLGPVLASSSILLLISVLLIAIYILVKKIRTASVKKKAV